MCRGVATLKPSCVSVMLSTLLHCYGDLGDHPIPGNVAETVIVFIISLIVSGFTVLRSDESKSGPSLSSSQKEKSGV